MVEVVSKGSRREDRGSKPIAYAEAGIPHYWRVESMASGARTLSVHTYRLDESANAYLPSGEHHERLVEDLCGPVEVDLGALT